MQWWGSLVGVPGAERITAFFSDYHQSLREQGGDGVKFENQSALEAVAMGRAATWPWPQRIIARWKLRSRYTSANDEEGYYLSPDSSVMRTSIDFFPLKPATHGRHVYANAQVGMWFGKFMHPDWDMFQSFHEWAGFHAAARTISGGPVYVSDKPEAHHCAPLRKLVLSDGGVLRADDIGRPTRDCLFVDPTREAALLKVFNRVGDCGLVALFNANDHPDPIDRTTITGSVGVNDVEGLSGDARVGFAHWSNHLWRTGRDHRESFALAEGERGFVTFAPVEHDVAILGLADKLNSTGAVRARRWDDSGGLTMVLRDGGTILIWAADAPRIITCDGIEHRMAYEANSGRLQVEIPQPGRHELGLKWRRRPAT